MAHVLQVEHHGLTSLNHLVVVDVVNIAEVRDVPDIDIVAVHRVGQRSTTIFREPSWVEVEPWIIVVLHAKLVEPAIEGRHILPVVHHFHRVEHP